MDLNPLLGIVSTFILHVPCSAIILVKFPQLSPQFISERQKASNLFDPLTDFGLVSRQILCDAVINAKQFSAHYNRAYYQAMLGVKVPMVSRTEWDDPSTIPFGITNYQRLLPMFETHNLASLRYVPRPLKFGKGGYDKVKTIQCVGTTNVKWYITFGFVDHFMYLLERRTYKLDSSLRISGLLEPSPVVSNLPEDYFYSQLLSPKIRHMEKICEVGLNDHIRLCGAILDVLSSKGSLDRRVPQINLVRSRVRLCLWKGIVSPQQPTKSAKVLRCMFHYKKEEWTPFYVLADVVEPGAVFVFLEGEDGNLYLHVRLIRITALLYPVGAKGRGVKSNTRASSRGGADQPKRKKRRITRKNSDNDTEENDESEKRGKGKQTEERGSEDSIKAEHSEEDVDNEDYIMSLLAGGKVKEEEFSQEDDDDDGGGAGDYSKSTGKVIQQEMKESSSSDGEPVAELRTYVRRKARSKRRNEHQTDEDVPKKPSSNNQPRGQQNKKDHDDQDTDYIYSRTRSRSKAMPEKRKEPMVTDDDEEDEDHTSSEDSEDDTEDDDYNLDEDVKTNLEDEDYEYSEDIEEERSRAVGSRSGTKDKQRNKEREKESRSKKGEKNEVHSLSKTKIKKEQDTGESESETSICGKTRHKILQTEEVREYCSEEDAENEDQPPEEDAEDDDFGENENNDSGGDSATLCDVGKNWREKRRRSSRKRPKRDELSPSPPRNKGKEILDEVQSERDDPENDDVDIAKGTHKEMTEIEAVCTLEQMMLLKGCKGKRGKRLRRKTGQKKTEKEAEEIGDASRRTKPIAADRKRKNTATVTEQEESLGNEGDVPLTSSEDLDSTNLSKTKKRKYL